MTPFFLLRMWLRRAPLSNRVMAAASVAVAVAVLIWIAVPGKSPSSVATSPYGAASGASSGQPGSVSNIASGPAQSGSAAGATGSGASNGAPLAVGAAGASGAAVAKGSASASNPSGSGAATLAGGASPAGSGGGGCSKMGAPIKVGVVLPNVGSGSTSVNGVLGVPPVSQQQADYSAVIDTINKAGGVQCHPLVGDFQPYNELNSSDSQTICLQFVQDHVYAVLGGFGPTSPDTCLLQNKIPTIEQIMISEADARKYYPYYLSANGAYELILRNFAYAAARLGYFGPAKGFKKLGVLERTCQPTEEPALTAALQANGVSSSQIDVFNFGCNSSVLFDPPNEISQAELQFWKDGVTDVTAVGASADLQAFTNDANNQQGVQHWKPMYLVPDDGAFATISAPQNVPNGSQFDGAIGITALQYGGIAAGFPEDAATKKCDAIMTSHNLPTVYQSGDNFAGSPCDLLWMLSDAMANDPGLAPAGLAAGLSKVGSVAMAYPDGPNNFSTPGVTWGGEEWREDVFTASCSCFKTVSSAFQPSF